jgi:hypothetical protein
MLASSDGAMIHAANPWMIQYTSHDQRLMPRKGMKLVAEAKPPIQWKITPRNGFGPKMPR